MAHAQVLVRSDRPLFRFSDFVAKCQDVLRSLRDPYRPERHYMRGPGPKWREKHGRAA